MEISSRQQSGITILTLDGRLDGETSPALEKTIHHHLANGQNQLLFDCPQLNYISSAGLRVFLLSSKKTTAAGGSIAFCSLQTGILEVFELSGFDQLFTNHPDLETALQTFL
ncbi:MAG: STAS domain-containing protein [Verrucomicrobiales bacterium]|nr:STAS domain-containing protein [Verrucomicrobiales bacterium]